MLLILAAVVTLFAPAFGPGTPDFDGKVSRVVDGRTLIVVPDRKLHGPSRGMAIRLYGIVIPSKPKAHAKRAAHYLKKLALGKKVGGAILFSAPQPFPSIVRVGDRELNSEMIKAGMSMVDSRAAKDYKHLAEAQRAARAAKRGIWANEALSRP